MVTALFFIWVAFSAYQGYRKGFWLTLLALLGFVAAYASTFLWGQPLGRWLQVQANIPILVAYSLAFGGVYFIVYLLVADVPRYVFASLLTRRNRQPALGVALGSGVGVLSGLVFVWAFGIMQATLQLNPSTNVEVIAEPPAPVQEIAGTVMGKVSRVGAQVVGASNMEAQVVAKFAAEPRKSLRDIQRLGQSAELKQFLGSRDTLEYLNRANLDGLIESSAFQGLINVPELADVRQLALEEVRQKDKHAGLRDGDKYIAAQLSQAWRKMNSMRNDPRVQGVMNDPQVKAMVAQRDLAGLLANSKVQTLMGLVMEGRVSAEEVAGFSGAAADDTAASVAVSASSIAVVNEPSPEPKTLYKWRDSEGRLRYTDEPSEAGDNAQKIIY